MTRAPSRSRLRSFGRAATARSTCPTATARWRGSPRAESKSSRTVPTASSSGWGGRARHGTCWTSPRACRSTPCASSAGSPPRTTRSRPCCSSCGYSPCRATSKTSRRCRSAATSAAARRGALAASTKSSASPSAYLLPTRPTRARSSSGFRSATAEFRRSTTWTRSATGWPTPSQALPREARRKSARSTPIRISRSCARGRPSCSRRPIPTTQRTPAWPTASSTSSSSARRAGPRPTANSPRKSPRRGTAS